MTKADTPRPPDHAKSSTTSPPGRADSRRASHQGEGTFAIRAAHGGRPGDAEPEVEAEGAYSGEFLLRTGTTFLDIQANGPWSLSRE
ncbi:hypothetical protein [Nonomuraea jiangxiensis]|uniref:Uncharacterized protein n=1 Tax=Nonomuraea jiangxiensis TaxID=633440 RepID=A0A1G9JR38_9ACTN|nr:hypothetical protein [Nonomuraea jiangxiensis]SDL39988.1 hypothetical protein SAMN05421869_125123 [Nonomuraea jiangxiensis]